MKFSILTLIFLHLTIFSFAQENTVNELHFEVKVNYPPLSITKAQLAEAQTIPDLNRFYKSSFVRTFESVEITTTQQGKIQKATSKDDTLTQEQKDLMASADPNTEIAVNVRYLPENNLSHNDVHEFPFRFLVNPEKDATYIGGTAALQQYLKENAIDKIPAGTFEGYDMTAVKFTVDAQGEITNAHIFESQKGEAIDALLLTAICEMPKWQPAVYADGMQASQELVLLVGNMENCMVHTLGVR